MATPRLSPQQTACAVRAHLDTALLRLQHSRGAWAEREYPLMRALLDDALAQLRAANAALAAHAKR
jgi:hypothetical protein